MISRSNFGVHPSSCGGQDVTVFEVAVPEKPFALGDIPCLKCAVEEGN